MNNNSIELKFGAVFPIVVFISAIFMTVYAHSFSKTYGSISFISGFVAVLIFIWLIVVQPFREVSDKGYLIVSCGLTIMFFVYYSEFLLSIYNVHIYQYFQILKPLGIILLIYGIYETIKDRRKIIEELKESIRQKELYIDILTHDIANPLTVIRGVIEYGDYSGREEREMALKNIHRITEIIEDMKIFSKLNAMENLPKQKIVINEVIEGIIKAFEKKLKEKNIKIEFNPKRKFCIYGNSLIKHVFSNLIDNAIKYSPKGTKIKINIEEEDGYILVSVADEGIGVPDEYKKSIFERFERGSKKGIRGTGLGLAIAKKVVELHNGKIWVEDNKPKGSIFYVKLPKG